MQFSGRVNGFLSLLKTGLWSQKTLRSSLSRLGDLSTVSLLVHSFQLENHFLLKVTWCWRIAQICCYLLTEVYNKADPKVIFIKTQLSFTWLSDMTESKQRKLPIILSTSWTCAVHVNILLHIIQQKKSWETTNLKPSPLFYRRRNRIRDIKWLTTTEDPWYWFNATSNRVENEMDPYTGIFLVWIVALKKKIIPWYSTKSGPWWHSAYSSWTTSSAFHKFSEFLLSLTQRSVFPVLSNIQPVLQIYVLTAHCIQHLLLSKCFNLHTLEKNQTHIIYTFWEIHQDIFVPFSFLHARKPEVSLTWPSSPTSR